MPMPIGTRGVFFRGHARVRHLHRSHTQLATRTTSKPTFSPSAVNRQAPSRRATMIRHATSAYAPAWPAPNDELPALPPLPLNYEHDSGTLPYPPTTTMSLAAAARAIRNRLENHQANILDILRTCALRSVAAALLAKVAAVGGKPRFADPRDIIRHVPHMARAAMTDPSAMATYYYYRRGNADGVKSAWHVRALLWGTSQVVGLAEENARAARESVHERREIEDLLELTLWDAIAEVRFGRPRIQLPAGEFARRLFVMVTGSDGQEWWELQASVAHQAIEGGFSFRRNAHGQVEVTGVDDESARLLFVREAQVAASDMDSGAGAGAGGACAAEGVAGQVHRGLDRASAHGGSSREKIRGASGVPGANNANRVVIGTAGKSVRIKERGRERKTDKVVEVIEVVDSSDEAAEDMLKWVDKADLEPSKQGGQRDSSDSKSSGRVDECSKSKSGDRTVPTESISDGLGRVECVGQRGRGNPTSNVRPSNARPDLLVYNEALVAAAMARIETTMLTIEEYTQWPVEMQDGCEALWTLHSVMHHCKAHLTTMVELSEDGTFMPTAVARTTARWILANPNEIPPMPCLHFSDAENANAAATIKSHNQYPSTTASSTLNRAAPAIPAIKFTAVQYILVTRAIFLCPDVRQIGVERCAAMLKKWTPALTGAREKVSCGGSLALTPRLLVLCPRTTATVINNTAAAAREGAVVKWAFSRLPETAEWIPRPDPLAFLHLEEAWLAPAKSKVADESRHKGTARGGPMEKAQAAPPGPPPKLGSAVVSRSASRSGLRPRNSSAGESRSPSAAVKNVANPVRSAGRDGQHEGTQEQTKSIEERVGGASLAGTGVADAASEADAAGGRLLQSGQRKSSRPPLAAASRP